MSVLAGGETNSITERQVQHALFARGLPAHELLLPNYTPVGWFECDVWGVTKGGYWREWEIKLTVSDFRADARKARKVRRYACANDGRTKHERLADGDVRGPKQFWYVMPEGLVAEAEVPTWAGIVWVNQTHKLIRLREARAAPKLHSQKVEPRIVEHARGVCYWRYWQEIGRSVRQQREVA